MSINLNLQPINSGYNLARINLNFQLIEEALKDVLSREGGQPNQMENNIDMNGYSLLNVGEISGGGGTGGGTGGITDHGLLSGLNDDDHQQYLNNERGDSRYYLKNVIDNLLNQRAALEHTHTANQINGLQEFVEDTVGGQIVAGPNVTVAYNDTTGKVTIGATVPQDTGGVELPLTTNGDMVVRADSANVRLPVGTEGQVLTVASGVPAWRAAPAGTGTGGTVDPGNFTAAKILTFNVGGTVQSANINSDDPFPTVSLGGVVQSPSQYSITNGVITPVGGNWPTAELVVHVSGTRVYVASGGTTSSANISDFQEAVEDRIGASIVAGSNVTVAYDDASGKTTISSTASGGGGSGGSGYATINPLQFGAVGDGNQANAAADTAGLIAALNNTATTNNMTVDLLGRTYWVNSPIEFAATGDWHHKRITNGWINVTGSFPSNRAVLDLSKRNCYASKVDHLFINGRKGGGTYAKEGILLNQSQEFRIDRCDIEGFNGTASDSGAGIRSLSPDYGRQTYISNCQICADFTSTKMEAIGIDIWGGDTQIIDCTVRESDRLVVLRKGAHTIKGGHYYYYSHPIGPGIVVWEASHIQITEAYIDSCGITLEGFNVPSAMGNRFISACGFNNNRFLTHPERNMPADFAFLTLKPRAANSVMHGFTFNDNLFQRNRAGQADPWPVRISTANGGSINNDAIYQSHMVDNSFDGVKQQTTRPRRAVSISNANFGTVSFGDVLPWGTVQRTLSGLFETNSWHGSWRTTQPDKGNRNVSMWFEPATATGSIIIQVDSNNDGL